MNKRITFALGLVMLVAGCTKAQQANTAPGGRINDWTQPHILRMADAGDVNTLNPHLGQFADVQFLSEMTMAWLIRWDQNNEPIPELATEVPTQANGGVSRDGLTITYHLRHGVKWSDGEPFTADDVVFSTKVVLNPVNNEVGREGWDQITSVTEPDKYTVVYHLKKPYSPFVEVFFSTAGANPCILPKHLLAQYPNINNVPYNALPVGIGPFKYLRWDRSSQVVMVANPLYWRGRPKLDEVIFKIVPDRNTVLSQLESKELDMWYQMPGNYLARASALTPFAILRQPSYYWDHVDFNLLRPAFKDPAVREALRLAIDRKTILEKIGHGVGILQEVTTPINAPYAVKSIPLVPFDIAAANALLDKVGWVRGTDGVRAKNGIKLALDVATSAGTPDADNELELIRSTWKQIGVSMDIRHYPPAMMFAPLEEGGIVYSNKWDIIVFAWQNEAIGDYSQPYGCQAFPPAGQNDPRWCDKIAQAAMDDLYTRYEQPARNKDVDIFEHRFVNDVPTIVLRLREDLYVYNRDLKNYHPNAITPFDNMMNVDI